MLSKIAKVLLVSTSFAPIFLTLWFADFSKKWNLIDGIYYLIITLILIALCFFIMLIAKKQLEKMPIQINSISTSDKEVIGFLLIYLLPLIRESKYVDMNLFVFIIFLFFVSIFTTNSYHFNPLLGFFGLHFYQVTIEGGITYILITRKNLTNTKNITKVVQISEYMILEVEE